MTDSPQKAGYKSPPAHTRFRPGQSGNPSGRPRRRPDFQAALLAELAETTPDAGGSKLDALVKTLVDSAIAGNARAQSILCSFLTRLGDAHDDESKPPNLDDQALLEDYVSDELNRRAAESKPVSIGNDSNAGDGHDR
jgi:hypothetical protein